jgi:hypothetical protein
VTLAWADLIPLIARYGLPWAIEFWRTVQKHPTPTEEAWAAILAIVNKTEAEYLAEARARLMGK